jgi:hypothetical protein
VTSMGNVVMLRPTLAAQEESYVARGPLRRCVRRLGGLGRWRGALRSREERAVGVAEHPRLVAARLVGRALPSVRMEIPGGWVWVHGITRGCLYLYRGGGGSPDDPADDVALHQAFRDHCRGLEVRGVSTHAARLQLHSIAEYELEHRLYSDGELGLAKALGLPTFRSGDRWFYERLVAIVDAGRIVRVIYPVDDAGCAAWASAWLRSH